MQHLKEFYRGKRIFITGHTGFKGAWLSEMLLSFGAEIAGYALEPTKFTPLFNMLELSSRMKSNIADIRDLPLLQKKINEFEPEIVIHMAAQPLVLASYENPVYTYDVNVMGIVNILEAIRGCKTVRSFINVTTDKVYENKEWFWGYRENERLCGFDPYSNSKSCSELVTYSYKKSFFNDKEAPAISTCRSGNVIGGGDFSENRIIPDCARAALNGQNILVRNPDSIRPYQHVLECLYGYLLLAMKQYKDKINYEGSYNFGPDENSCVTTGELVSIFCKAWGDGLSWYSDSFKQGTRHEANFLKLDCSKAKSKLNWYPALSIEQAVGYVTDWLRIYRSKGSIRACIDEQIEALNFNA